MSFCCTTKESNEKLLVDAGYFLDNNQNKEIEAILKSIDKKGYYHFFLYTVIAEKYYRYTDYDEYVFNTVSMKDSINNLNVLLYLSYDDKKIKIHTGNKAKEILTDSLSQAAINRLIPYLTQRQYYDGIKLTIYYIDSIMKGRNAKY